MPTQDAILFHPLQKPASSDLNDAQSLIARELADVARYLNATTTFNSAEPPSTATRNVVLNGLNLVPNGADVSVLEGVLAQNSNSIVPTPGALDSTYRIGINRDPVTVPMPAPVVDSWVLVEAQVVATTTTASVEFLNPTTKNFVPTANTPRMQEIGVTFQTTTAAATIPAFTGAQWVPIAAVFRPSSGGAVTPADIIDLRPLWASRAAHCNESVPSASNPVEGGRRGAPGSFKYDPATSEATLVAEAFTSQGDRLWFSGAFDPTSVDLISQGLTFAADTWYYVYLAPFRLSYTPVNAQALPLNTQARGLLIVTDVAPVDGVNSAAILPPAPFDTSPLMLTRAAVCVAALRRNSANNNFVATYSSDGREFILGGTSAQPSPVFAATLTPPVIGNNAITPAAGATPECATVVLAALTYNGGAGSPADIRFYIASNTALATSFAMLEAQDSQEQIFRVEIPRALFGSNDYTVVFGNAPDAASTLSIRYYGWRM